MIPGRTKNFIGQDGAFIFFGIVESRLDPENAGRVQVRCFGIHSDDPLLIPTEDLPWATVSSPVSSSDDPHDLVEGDMVWGFFVDGQEMQEPLVCGCIQSRPGGNKNPQRGFTDRGVGLSGRPRKPASYTENSFEDAEPSNNSEGSFKPPLNQYSGSGETLADRAKSAKGPVSIPGVGGSTLNEPGNPANRQFPYNKAKESESGHVFELDDSPGAERVHVFHRSGSFIEVHPDGTVVKKDVAAGYEITLGPKILYTASDMMVSNDGVYAHRSGSSYTIEVASGDMIIDVKAGNLNMKVNGDVNLETTGNVNETVGGNYSVNVAGSYNVKAATINLN